MWGRSPCHPPLKTATKHDLYITINYVIATTQKQPNIFILTISFTKVFIRLVFYRMIF